MPESETALEGIGVVAGAAVVGQCAKVSQISTPDDDLIGQQCSEEFIADGGHVLAPAIFTEPFQSAIADVVLEGLALAIGQVGLVHGHDFVVHDQTGPQARAEPQKEHAAAVVAAHRGALFR